MIGAQKADNLKLLLALTVQHGGLVSDIDDKEITRNYTKLVRAVMEAGGAPPLTVTP